MWFRKKRKKSNFQEYIDIQKQLDKEHNIMMQKFEDEKIERGIKKEAQQWLLDYITAPEITVNGKTFKNCIHILNPFIYAIMIYDEETSKYKDSNIQELVRKEYEVLLANYKENEIL